MHSVSVLAARDALRTWTIMLGVLAFSMSMLGTFLVRSGVLTSVHAFAVDPERGIEVETASGRRFLPAATTSVVPPDGARRYGDVDVPA